MPDYDVDQSSPNDVLRRYRWQNILSPSPDPPREIAADYMPAMNRPTTAWDLQQQTPPPTPSAQDVWNQQRQKQLADIQNLETQASAQGQPPQPGPVLPPMAPQQFQSPIVQRPSPQPVQSQAPVVQPFQQPRSFPLQMPAGLQPFPPVNAPPVNAPPPALGPMVQRQIGIAEQMPTLGEFPAPSRRRSFWGNLAGVAAGVMAANPMAGMDMAARIKRGPFQAAMENWEQQYGKASLQAKIEEEQRTKPLEEEALRARTGLWKAQAKEAEATAETWRPGSLYEKQRENLAAYVKPVTLTLRNPDTKQTFSVPGFINPLDEEVVTRGPDGNFVPVPKDLEITGMEFLETPRSMFGGTVNPFTIGMAGEMKRKGITDPRDLSLQDVNRIRRETDPFGYLRQESLTERERMDQLRAENMASEMAARDEKRRREEAEYSKAAVNEVIHQVFENPGAEPNKTYRTRPDYRQIQMAYNKRYGLPFPNDLTGMELTARDAADKTLGYVNTAVRLINDPDVAKSVGRIWGTVGTFEQWIKSPIFGRLDPVAAQKAQELRTALNYLFFQEGTVVTRAGRVSDKTLEILGHTAPKTTQDLNFFKGSLQGIKDTIDIIADETFKERFNQNRREYEAGIVRLPDGRTVPRVFTPDQNNPQTKKYYDEGVRRFGRNVPWQYNYLYHEHRPMDPEDE